MNESERHAGDRGAVDEGGQRLDAEAVLPLGEMALLAEVAVAQYVERVGEIEAVDDAQVVAAGTDSSAGVHDFIAAA